MDALKMICSKGAVKYGFNTSQAIRTSIAEGLRDVADEIEAGRRVVCELETFEAVRAENWPVSILKLMTSLQVLPKEKA